MCTLTLTFQLRSNTWYLYACGTQRDILVFITKCVKTLNLSTFTKKTTWIYKWLSRESPRVLWNICQATPFKLSSSNGPLFSNNPQDDMKLDLERTQNGRPNCTCCEACSSVEILICTDWLLASCLRNRKHRAHKLENTVNANSRNIIAINSF